jgi:hypothetical protein
MEHLSKNPNFHLKTYRPAEKFEIGKEAPSAINRVGGSLSRIGGIFQLVYYSLGILILGIFKAQDKIKHFQMRKERVLDLRKKIL